MDAAFRAHWNGLAARAQRYVGSREAAEDVVQSAFVRLALSLRADEPLPSAADITHRLYRYVDAPRLEVRSPRSFEAVALTPELAETIPDAESVEEIVEAWDAATWLWQAVDSLPPRHRMVLVLLLDGMTSAEISGALSISPSETRSRLHQARRLLAKTLGTTAMGAHRPGAAQRPARIVLRGRVVKIEQDEFVAVAGPSGDDSNLVVRLPVRALRLKDQLNLSAGSVFDWVLDRRVDVHGVHVARSAIRLDAERSFTTAERTRIKERADVILNQLRSFRSGAADEP